MNERSVIVLATCRAMHASSVCVYHRRHSPSTNTPTTTQTMIEEEEEEEETERVRQHIEIRYLLLTSAREIANRRRHVNRRTLVPTLGLCAALTSE